MGDHGIAGVRAGPVNPNFLGGDRHKGIGENIVLPDIGQLVVTEGGIVEAQLLTEFALALLHDPADVRHPPFEFRRPRSMGPPP